MPTVAVLGHFDLHPDDADAASQLMRVMMEETNKESGCRHYAYSRDLSHEHRFQLSELWDDDASLEAHFHAPHTATYRAGMSHLRVIERVVTRYHITEGTRL